MGRTVSATGRWHDGEDGYQHLGPIRRSLVPAMMVAGGGMAGYDSDGGSEQVKAAWAKRGWCQSMEMG